MSFFVSLWNYLLMSSPYLLLGLILSAFIHAFIPMEKIQKFLGRRKKTDVLYAAMVGVPLPLCSCSVIPTAITLKQNGASNGATSAFLISTPESGLDSILVTKALMDWPMTILRPIGAFFSGFLAGGLQLAFNNEETTYSIVTEKKSCCSHKPDCHDPVVIEKKVPFTEKMKSGFRYAFVDLVNDFSFWMVIGILSGALIDVLIPADFFTNIPAWQSKLMIIAIGIPLYICASASTPIAASLVLKGLSPGSALLFLMVGPATNVSNILVMQKYIGKKGVLINLFSIIAVALIMSFFTDWFYTNYYHVNFKLGHGESHDHCMSCSPWVLGSTILMTGLLLKGLFHKYFSGKHDHDHDHGHAH